MPELLVFPHRMGPVEWEWENLYFYRYLSEPGIGISRTVAALPQSIVRDRNTVRRNHHAVYRLGNVRGESLMPDGVAAVGPLRPL